MTVPELKAIAQHALDFAAEYLCTHGSLEQMFHLVKRDGSMEIMLVEGQVTNDGTAKDGLSTMLRSRVAAGEIEAVIMLSDTFVASISVENDKIRRALKMNVEEASAFGLCEKQEAIIVTLESPVFARLMKQEYRRDGGAIELVGSTDIMDDTDPGTRMLEGRFTGFFRGTTHRA